MQVAPSKQEEEALAAIWRDQAPAQGPVLDFTHKAWPFGPGHGADHGPHPDTSEVARLLIKALTWPKWARLYAKPSLAVLALSRLARSRGLPAGIKWVAPGTGAPFDPPCGPPGLAVLKCDWAPDGASLLTAQKEAKNQGLILAVDESVTGFRLGRGGACQYYDLSPEVAIYGPALAGGADFAALVGRGEPPPKEPKEPLAAALAAAAGIIPQAGEEGLAQRLSALGRLLALGLSYFARRAGVAEQIRYDGGPWALPRLAGRRLWAYIQLAKEEGLALAPLVLLDPRLDPEIAPQAIWPRLARAAARLKVLPEGEKAPQSWPEAARLTRGL